MSTSPLYHAFCIRGYEYVRTEYLGGEVIFSIRHEPKTFRCENCGVRRPAAWAGGAAVPLAAHWMKRLRRGMGGTG
jgi:hypothetical protein